MVRLVCSRIVMGSMKLSTGRALLNPHVLLKRAGLRSGMRYADFGSGGLGHFVFDGCSLVGEGGQVFAVDILPRELDRLQRRAQDESVHNLSCVRGDIERLHGVAIDDWSLHLVSLVGVAGLVLGELDTLEETARVLRSDGRVLIVDWKPGVRDQFVPQSMHASLEEVTDRLVRFGFVVETTFDAGPEHWGIIAHRS